NDQRAATDAPERVGADNDCFVVGTAEFADVPGLTGEPAAVGQDQQIGLAEIAHVHVAVVVPNRTAAGNQGEVAAAGIKESSHKAVGVAEDSSAGANSEAIARAFIAQDELIGCLPARTSASN